MSFLTALVLLLQSQTRHVIGYFDSDTSQDFKIYHKVASILRDDCSFHAAIGSVHVLLSCVYHGSHCDLVLVSKAHLSANIRNDVLQHDDVPCMFFSKLKCLLEFEIFAEGHLIYDVYTRNCLVVELTKYAETKDSS